MYDELWTAAKAMYKLEPVMAPGGEIVIYAPHLDTVSRVHGKYIFQTGYHTLAYFLANWDYYKRFPECVSAFNPSARLRHDAKWQRNTHCTRHTGQSDSSCRLRSAEPGLS